MSYFEQYDEYFDNLAEGEEAMSFDEFVQLMQSQQDAPLYG